MSYDLVIKNGLLVTASETFTADLAIRGERIVALGDDLTADRVIDARGLYVLPGAIDGHVHFDDPTFPPYARPTADNFATGTIAAAYGGTTTVIDFAQPKPGQSLVAELDRRLSDAEGQAVIDYSVHMTLRDPDPARLDEIQAVMARGVPSFKLYMTYDGYRMPDDAMLRAMQRIAVHGGLAIVHAENDGIIAELQRQYTARGQTGPRWHSATRPAHAEAEAVQRALAIAAIAGARVLIFHISCIEAVRVLRAARDRGQQAFGETCPHYLVLNEERLLQKDLLSQSLMVMPPIRDLVQQRNLWQSLAINDLDIISSDHCPRHPESDLLHHPAGVSSIEPRLALIHTFGVRTGRISLTRWVDLCCSTPARIFGLTRKGNLAPGFDADIVIFDPNQKLSLTPRSLHSPISFCSYDGIIARGLPMTTISRGEIIIDQGKFVGREGRGRFVTRSFSEAGSPTR